LLAVFLLITAALTGLAGRLAWLQLVDGNRLLARARSIQTQSIDPIGERRTVVDRMGRLVAIDEERFTSGATPVTSIFLEIPPSWSAPQPSWPDGSPWCWPSPAIAWSS